VVKTVVVVVFVCWHLFFLLVRNPVDLWEKPILAWAEKHFWWKEVEPSFKKIDYATYYYGNFAGVQQGWSMFSPEMARRAPFLTARIDFTDGSQEVLSSENEPADPSRFFRFGGWRQRKLEDSLLWTKPKELPDCEDLPLFKAYVRWSIRHWHEANPDDPRQPQRVELLRRILQMPGPHDNPWVFPVSEEVLIGTFSPEGEVAP